MASEQHPPSVVVNRDDAEQLEIEKKNKFIMDWILGLNASWAMSSLLKSFEPETGVHHEQAEQSSATSTTEDEEDEEDEINDNEDYDENDEEDYENDEEDEEEDAEDADEEQPEDEESENDENGLTHHIISVNMKDNDFLTYTFFTELRKALAQNHSSWPGLVSKFASFSRDFRYLKCAIEMVLEKNETWRPYNVQELYDKVFHKLKQRELIPTFDLQVVLFTLLSVFEKSTTASYQHDYNLYHYIYPMIIELYEYLLERWRDKTSIPSTADQHVYDLNIWLSRDALSSFTGGACMVFTVLLEHYNEKYQNIALIAGARSIQNDMIL